MIKLLDGSEWNKEELKLKMYDDSFYYGYLGKNALSSSSVKPLYKSPMAYKSYITESISNEKPLREGRLFHSLLLEYETIQKKYVFVDASTRSTKKYKEAVEENKGYEVFLEKELRSISYLISIFESNVEASSYLRNGVAEEPGIGELFGFPFRAKADYVTSDLIIDVKTTNSLDGWEWSAKKSWHYDMQAWIYTQIFGIQNFLFLVIDKGTGEIGEFSITKETLEIAGDKVELACQRYSDYFYEKTKNVNEYIRKGFL